MLSVNPNYSRFNWRTNTALGVVAFLAVSALALGIIAALHGSDFIPASSVNLAKIILFSSGASLAAIDLAALIYFIIQHVKHKQEVQSEPESAEPIQEPIPVEPNNLPGPVEAPIPVEPDLPGPVEEDQAVEPEPPRPGPVVVPQPIEPEPPMPGPVEDVEPPEPPRTLPPVVEERNSCPHSEKVVVGDTRYTIEDIIQMNGNVRLLKINAQFLKEFPYLKECDCFDESYRASLELYLSDLTKSLHPDREKELKILSIGSGYCFQELAVIVRHAREGYTKFSLDLVENDKSAERAAQSLVAFVTKYLPHVSLSVRYHQSIDQFKSAPIIPDLLLLIDIDGEGVSSYTQVKYLSQEALDQLGSILRSNTLIAATYRVQVEEDEGLIGRRFIVCAQYQSALKLRELKLMRSHILISEQVITPKKNDEPKR